MLLENVCTLPLTDDVFTTALHPSQPLLMVGLASGHVQAFRLPENNHASPDYGNDDDATASVLSDGRATIDTAWRTHRHKGSCRAVDFGPDDAYSAGLDCLIKHFSSETGQVVSKIWVPHRKKSSRLDAPTLLRVLNPQSLLLGTDSGALHIIDLRAHRSSLADKPAQTHVPHSDYVAGIAPLPATATSTSGFPRQWASVGGTTLAVTDVRRGVIARSEDQEDELLSARFIKGVGPRGKQNNGVVAVGSGSGVVTLWDRGVWDDQTERIVVDKGVGVGAGAGGESIDAMAVAPEDAKWGNCGRSVVVGMGDGALKVVDVLNRSVLETLRHDDLEGVVGVEFDCLDRLISAGGRTIKVWEESVARAEDDSEDDSEDESSEEDSEEDSGEDSEEEEEEEEPTPPKAKDTRDKGMPVNRPHSNGTAPAKKDSGTSKGKQAPPMPAKGNKRPAPESSDDESSDDQGDDDDDDDESEEDDEEKQIAIMRKRKEAAKKARLGPRGAHGILAFDGLD